MHIVVTMSQSLRRVLAVHWEKFLWLFIISLPLLTVTIALGVYEVERTVIVGNRISTANHAFGLEMQNALQKTKLAVQDGTITNAIINNDASTTETDLTILAQKYDLSTMVAVNAEGVAIARTPSLQRRDLVFLTTPWGISAAQGKETVLVGPGRNYQFVIISAVPIVQNGSVQGALFGGYILDDAYAVKFKTKYLDTNEEVAFYSLKMGVYGTSFQDPAIAHLFKVLFNEGSDAIQRPDAGLIAGHFKAGNTIFRVGNIQFTGPDGKITGGMFVLTPVYPTIPPLIGALFWAIIVVLLSLYMRKRLQENGYHIIVPISALVLILVGTLISIKVIGNLLYDVTPPVQTIYNSTMEFTPESDIFSDMSEQRIGIHITTGGEAINVAQATILYDPKTVRIADIIVNNSFCDEQYVIEKTIDNENGTAVISCAKPGGFFADNATLAELLVQPLRPGQLTLRFAPETQVLANDGLGTNVLRTTTDGSYLFVDSVTGNRNNSPEMFSYSHPNQTRWYNNRNISINWARIEESESFSWVFDQQPATIPDEKQVTINTGVNLNALKDGIYYFHLKPRYTDGVGLVGHLKLMIDTTLPAPPLIKSSATEIAVGETVRLEFLNQGDTMSGLQKNFYVQFDAGTWLPTLPRLDIPFLDTGTHTISVRVFDNAGNYSDASSKIIVR